jgi:hypothetical protein
MRVFGGKKKQGVEETGSEPVYVQAWGWAAAAAKFRGMVAMLAILSNLCLAGALLWFIGTNKTVVVGMDSEGRPQILQSVSTEKNPEIFCRDFASFLFNYTARTAKDNLTRSRVYMTPAFLKAWDQRFGQESAQLVAGVVRDDVVLVTSILRVDIEDMTNDGFTAKIFAQRIRSDKVNDRTYNSQIVITANVVKGPVTVANPWGLYVNDVKEEELGK